MGVFNPLRYLAPLIREILKRMQYRLATKQTLHGIPVAVTLLSSDDDEEAAAFNKIDSALELIANFAPKRFESLSTDVSLIYVKSGLWAFGLYDPGQKLVELNGGYLTDPKTTHPEVACTLIHEAQHGRLHRLGFGYEDAIRTRIERICVTAERVFARRLPGSEALVAKLEEKIELDLEPFLSDEAMWRADQTARINEIRNHGVPGWIIRLVEWRFRRAARRHFPRKNVEPDYKA